MALVSDIVIISDILKVYINICKHPIKGAVEEQR